MASSTSVIIVNWNGAAYLQRLIHSLLQQQPLELIVVDNASTDQSLEVLCSFPGIKVITNEKNLGFGTAANQGIRQSQGPFLLILNVDIEALPGSVNKLEEFLLHNPSVAIVAPQLLNPDGTIQPSCRSFPTVGRLFLYLSFLDRVFPGSYRLSRKKHEQIREVDQPMGAALMIRRSVLESTGPFDERFFMYMEEVDLCERIKREGWKIVYFPEAKMVHFSGGSTIQAYEKSQEDYFRSLLLYFQKRAASRLFVLRLALSVALLIRTIVLFFSGDIARMRLYWKILFRIVWSPVS